MTGGTRVVAIGSGGQETAPDGIEQTEVAEAPPAAAETWDEPEEAPRRRPWGAIVVASLAILAVSSWTLFYGWVNRTAMLAGAPPAQWIGWITQWSTPVLLVAVSWLIAMRSSRREASRFGDAAVLLRDESAKLETRLITVNQELSLAREFIAAQSRDLESLGRVAVERLSQNADKLAGLIHDNGQRIDTIGTVSTTALENMEKLRGQLPVIASSAKDVTNHIGTAGRTAHGQLQELVNGFGKLNEFGQASERQVMSLRTRITDALGEFERQASQLETIATERFASLAERGTEFRTEMDGHEVQALAAIRNRAKALSDELVETRQLLEEHEDESLTSLRSRLTSVRDESTAVTRSLRDGESSALDAWRKAIGQLGEDLRSAIAQVEEIDRKALESAQARLNALAEEAVSVDARLTERNRIFDAEISQRRVAAEAREQQSLAALTTQLTSLDDLLSSRRLEQEAQTRKLADHAEAIAAQLTDYAARMQEIAAHGSEAEAGIGASLTTLADRLRVSREALSGTDKAVNDLTDGSVRLLELIQASVQHSKVDLPAAMQFSEDRLTALEGRAIILRDTVGEAESRGAALSDYVIAANTGLATSLGALDAAHERVGAKANAHAVTLAELHGSLAALQDSNVALADHAQSVLRESIEQLAGSARDAVAGIEAMSASAVAALAERVGAESSAAIDKAMRSRAAEAVGQLEQAAAHAAGVSREAAVQLRDQLGKVNELAGNLERRVAQARQRAEEQVDNDFARRVALITEALNSNAIDIAKALSTDVTDTAWAAYLRGDRGVFTRRAVRLLDNSEAKGVAQIYENDREFREHVSRYIHDFEAMLRQLLSTRDGHALGVTLLSSDMGKLYVAMAQSIERLRA